MRKILLIILILSLSLFSFANPNSRSKNVVIWNQSRTGQGSGVIIQQGILTAAHVVEDSFFTHVRYYGERQSVVEIVLKYDKQKDLALLSRRANILYSRIANNEAVIDEEVYIIGSGWDHFWSVKRGRVSNVEGSFLILDLSIYPGDSGSPVYNKKDEVTGVVQAIDVVISGPGQGYAKRLQEIKAFLNE